MLKLLTICGAIGASATLSICSPAVAVPVPLTPAAMPAAPPGFTLTTFATAPSAMTTGPDDIAMVEGHVFVGWQNGVGTKGEPSPTGQTNSDVIEYTGDGNVLQHWSLAGKVDGMGGDAATGKLIVTVNEDGNSSLHTIDPSAPASDQVRHYTYSPEPDSAATGGVLTGGGTDAVVVRDGVIYLSASNPGAANATAAFRVDLDRWSAVAYLSPTFADNATATDAVSHDQVKLGLMDPDSNAIVPLTSPRFAGDFVVDGQADQQLVFVRARDDHRFRGGDRPRGDDTPRLTRLLLSHGGSPAGVDDIRWAEEDGGALYVVDSKVGAIYKITGPFTAGEAFGSLATVGTAAQTTELDTINLRTGGLSTFASAFGTVKGLLWVG